MMWGSCPWCGGSVGYGTSFWSMGLMLLFGLLVVVGIVLLVIWAARSTRGDSDTSRTQQPSDSAQETLRRRYANGEITKEQYDEMRRTLGG